MWWMLAREVLRLRGTISRETPWEVMPDLYFYRDPEEVEHEEELEFKEETAADQQMPPDDTWGVTDKVCRLLLYSCLVFLLLPLVAR